MSNNKKILISKDDQEKLFSLDRKTRISLPDTQTWYTNKIAELKFVEYLGKKYGYDGMIKCVDEKGNSIRIMPEHVI